MIKINPSILSKTVKAITPKTEKVEEAQIRGTIVFRNQEHFVQLDGAPSNALTPIANFAEGASDAGFVHGDRVLVLIKNHQAIVTKNLTTGLQAQAAKEASTFTTAITDEGITAQRIIANDTFTNTLRANNITADEIIAGMATIDTLDANYAHITNGVIDNAKIGVADVNDLSANYAHITTGVIDNAKIDVADVNNLSANYAHITNGVIDNAKIGVADVNNLSANYAHITDGVIDNAKIGYANVNNLDAHYAQIDIANVNNAWIENGTIKKAEVFDENVFDLSGNRATLSRLDASKINVANLRADNLVVRRINGQPVVGGYTLIDSNSPGYSSKNPQALGWYEFVNADWVLSTDTTVDMTKAYYQEGNGVSLYDQAYIDSLESDLQQQIDGAVETFTGSVVPTLTNWPYTDWYDTSVTPIHDERAKHVGDIYYVVNSSSPQGGYCYRFTYDNTTHAYSWVLIKDSDVTKALSDISELQTFESETTSWIEETDQGLETIRTNYTNLSGRVDDVEDTANAALPAADFQVFESTTFTDLVDEVDEQSTTMQNMTTRLGLNSDGTGSTTDIVAKESALEQTVNGITSRVSATETKLIGMYATSSTAEGTAAKVATITPAIPSGSTWTLGTGTTVTVKFTAANTTASPTLNINGTGAKPIKTYANGNLSEAEYKWKAGSTFTFTYNGTNWLMQDSTASVRMSSAETEIQQTANNVLIKATKSGATDAEKTAGGTSAIGLINVSPDNVVIAAKHVDIAGAAVFNNYSTTTEMNTAIGDAVDGIEVGGRNLHKSSASFGFAWNYDTGASRDGEVITITRGTTGETRIYQLPANGYWAWEPNTEYVVSIEAKGNAGGETLAMQCNGGVQTYHDDSATLTTSWKRHTRRFKTASSVTTGSMSYYLMTDNSTIQLRKPKLEKGTKPTDWSPAPEDVQAEIDAKKSTFTINATGTDASQGYAQILAWAQEGQQLTWAVDSTDGIKVGDTVRIKTTVANMSNAPVYVVTTCRETPTSSTSIKTTSHGLDTTIIDGGNILTNSIGTNQIKANAITASKIQLGDFNNYITATETDSSSLVTTNGGTISNGWLYKSSASQATLWLSEASSQWAREGDKYRITGKVKAPATGCAVVVIYGRGTDGSANANNSLTVPITAANTEVNVDGIITIGSSVAAQPRTNVAIIFCTTSGWTENYQAGYCKQMKCERMSGASLIVDGAITADKIAANAVTIGNINQSDSSTASAILNSNIKIGGVNYLTPRKGIAIWNFASGARSGTYSVSATLAQNTTGTIRLGNVIDETNVDWTLSYDMTISGAVNVQMDYLDSAYSTKTAYAAGTHHIVFTGKPTRAIDSTYNFADITADTSASGVTIKIFNLKIEKGNKATSWTPAPEDTNIGINLFKDSDNLLQGWVMDGATLNSGVATISTTRRIYQMPANGYWGSWKANTTYTVSIEAKGNTSGLYLNFEPYAGGVSVKQVPITTSWQRYSYTFTSNTNTSTSSCTFFNPSANGSATIDVRRPKLEYGDVETPWSAAPQDLASSATAYITHINNDGIRVHPSSTENNSVVINANGMEVFKGGTAAANSVAFYGDTARVGKIAANSGNTRTTSTGMDLYVNTTKVGGLNQKANYVDPDNITRTNALFINAVQYFAVVNEANSTTRPVIESSGSHLQLRSNNATVSFSGNSEEAFFGLDSGNTNTADDAYMSFTNGVGTTIDVGVVNDWSGSGDEEFGIWTESTPTERWLIGGTPDGHVMCEGIYLNTSSSGSNVRTIQTISGQADYQLRRYVSSSRRYKEDIADLTDSELDADRLYDLRAVQFRYKDDYLDYNDPRYGKLVSGFIAEEVEEAYPIAVQYEDEMVEDWEPKFIIPPMLKLIQDQKKKIDELEQRLEALERK